MLVSRLIPLVAFGAVVFHSSGAIKDRLAAMGGIGDQIVAKQRIVAMLDAASLQVTAGDDLNFARAGGFHSWVRQHVRVRGNIRGDAGLDPWGIPYRGTLVGRTLNIVSAGPDRQFGTKDDIKNGQDVYAY